MDSHVCLRLNKRAGAFTLIELLVVIVIVAILAGILLPVLGQARARADRATEIGQMHQIAVALAAYPADNNNRLPGPLFPGQMAMLAPSTNGRLVFALAPYLGVAMPTTPQLQPLFIPPAYRRTVSASFLTTARIFVMNMDVPTSGGTTVNPWGNATVATGGEPLTLGQVPTEAWAFSDADQLHPRVVDAPWKANTPAQTIYGVDRLAVRFDGSAGTIGASELAVP